MTQLDSTIILPVGREREGDTYQMLALSTFSGRWIVQDDCSPMENAYLYGNQYKANVCLCVRDYSEKHLRLTTVME